MATVIDICNTALARVGVRDFIQSLDDASMPAEACAALFPTTLDEVTAEFSWPFATKHATLALVQAPYAAWSGATTYGLGQQVTVAGTAGYFVSLQAGNLNNAPNTGGTAFWQYVSTYTRSGWNYMYAIPSDCAAPQRIQYQPDYGIGGPYVTSPPDPPPMYMRQQTPNTFTDKPEWVVEASDAADGTSVLLTNMVGAELIYTVSLQAAKQFPAAFSVALAWLLARDLAMALPNKADYAKQAQAMYTNRLNWAVARAINTGQQQREPASEFIQAR